MIRVDFLRSVGAAFVAALTGQELPLNDKGVALIETLPPNWDGYPYV